MKEKKQSSRFEIFASQELLYSNKNSMRWPSIILEALGDTKLVIYQTTPESVHCLATTGLLAARGAVFVEL